MIRRLIVIGVFAAGLGGCARPRDCGAVASYRGAPPSLLECVAASGDKLAQLELGIRYEDGTGGVARNVERAEQLYAKAAGGQRGRYIYSPPVGSETYGRVVQVTLRGADAGLPEASRRLARLRAARTAGKEPRS